MSSKILTNCISSFHSFFLDGKKLYLPSFFLNLQQSLPSYSRPLIFLISQREDKQSGENFHKLPLPHLPTFICTHSYSTFSPNIKANSPGSCSRPTSLLRHWIPPSFTYSKQLCLKLCFSHHHLLLSLLLLAYYHLCTNMLQHFPLEIILPWILYVVLTTVDL